MIHTEIENKPVDGLSRNTWLDQCIHLIKAFCRQLTSLTHTCKAIRSMQTYGASIFQRGTLCRDVVHHQDAFETRVIDFTDLSVFVLADLDLRLI